MRTIVVGADGSADSRRAVEWAAELAEENGARVVAVHAVGLLEHERGDPGGSHLLPQFEVWTAALDRLEASQVERRLVAGEPVDALRAAAADCAADLVVVGTRGAGARGGARLGSTSLRLAASCECPVVIVPVRSAAARP